MGNHANIASMDNVSLKTFLCIMRTGAVGSAAKLMNVSQSTASRRIKVLEQTFDERLFVPAGRGVAPTPAAHRLRPQAEAAVAAMEAAFEAMRRDAGELRDLRLAATGQTIAALIAPAMEEIVRAGINLGLVEAGGAEIGDLVRSGTCDCGVTAQPSLDVGLCSLDLGNLKILATSPAFDETVANLPLDINELQNKELLLLDRTFQSRVILDAVFRAEPWIPNIAFTGRSTSAIFAMAEAGRGVALLPSSVATRLPSRILTHQGRQLTIPIALVHQQQNVGSEVMERLCRVLEEKGQVGSILYGGNPNP